MIRENKREYQGFGRKHKKKTKMTRHLLENVIHGRFVGQTENGVYVLLTKKKARGKIRQALSERIEKIDKDTVVFYKLHLLHVTLPLLL